MRRLAPNVVALAPGVGVHPDTYRRPLPPARRLLAVTVVRTDGTSACGRGGGLRRTAGISCSGSTSTSLCSSSRSTFMGRGTGRHRQGQPFPRPATPNPSPRRSGSRRPTASACSARTWPTTSWAPSGSASSRSGWRHDGDPHPARPGCSRRCSPGGRPRVHADRDRRPAHVPVGARVGAGRAGGRRARCGFPLPGRDRGLRPVPERGAARRRADRRRRVGPLGAGDRAGRTGPFPVDPRFGSPHPPRR
ncbi:MAG: hypothetical protein QOJ30_4673 [Pseudonocardiales bacterium]|jgi:hypothetical protein|nr:hypothetical protein [Pseudonocardiales bacterium]